MKTDSLHYKINFAIFITCVVIAIIFGAILLPFESRRHKSHEKKIELLLDTVIQQKYEDIANEFFAGQKRALAVTFTGILKTEGIAAVSVHNPGGELFLASDDLFSADMTAHERNPLVQSPRFTTQRYNGRFFGIYSRAVEVIGQTIGYIRVYYDLSDLEKETRLSAIIFFTLLLMTLSFICGLLNIFLSHFVIKPVSLLRDAINEVRNGRLGETVFLPFKDEIGEMGAAFNEMSVKLCESQATSKQIEEYLRSSERKFRDLYEGSRDGFIMTDLEGRIMECNSIVCEMLGYTMAEIKNLTNFDITHRKSNDFERDLLIGQIKKGYTDLYEKECVKKNGMIFPVEVRTYLSRDEKGKGVGLWGFMRDITETKALRAEAMRQSRLASLGELAAGVAHEINNPINSIINYAQILVNRGEKQNADIEIPKKIIKEGDRIELIVKGLLSFGRERREEKCSVRPDVILADTLNLTATSLRKDNIAVKLEFSKNLPAIRANAQQMQQVLLNIISNARYALNRKYPQSDPDKFMEIKMEAFEQDVSQMIRITVHDRGEGISAEIIDKICDPFFSTKPYGKGTGLGLSISHGIIKSHEGELRFESEEGKYTKSIIELPVHRQGDGA